MTIWCLKSNWMPLSITISRLGEQHAIEAGLFCKVRYSIGALTRFIIALSEFVLEK